MCLGIPGQIVEIVDAAKKLAKVDVSGVKRQVNIACIVSEDHPVASCLGDWVLVPLFNPWPSVVCNSRQP